LLRHAHPRPRDRQRHRPARGSLRGRAAAPTWQPSDLPKYHPGLQAWLDAGALPNVLSPLAFDIAAPDGWPEARYEAVFTANTLHIAG
jgi:hypothetical protein